MVILVKSAMATHNRAGEITYRYLGPSPALTYEITIITYTKTSSIQADRPTLDSVYFGDGSPPVQFVRSEKINMSGDISRNKYVRNHTYSGNGSFLIHYEDPNRNEGVVNIPNSVDKTFYISTLLVINPFLVPNNSPVLTYPPIDKGCIGRTYIHNPNAFDPDGTDSLSYELTLCRGAGGLPIPGYTFPATSGTFSIDAITGDLIWNAPVLAGEYNIAFLIHEWRNGIKFGTVTRDMQVLIGDCNNRPPEFLPLADTCIVAGDSLAFDVTAIDPDGHLVVLSATGGPFQVANPALFSPVRQFDDTATSRFIWNTDCSHIRPQAYYAQFRAEDSTANSLVNLNGVFIRVIGPAPQNLTVMPVGNNMQLDWDPPSCSSVLGYNVYRRNGLYPGAIQCPCDNGAPSYTGYSMIGFVPAGAGETFTDNNNGSGLVIGVEYCYIVTAVYAGGTESCATDQECGSLKKDLPVITNADVRVTDLTNGSVYVAWSMPSELDTVMYPGPYEYRVYHSTGFSGTTFSLFATLSDLSDTTIIDTLINTVSTPWSYKVELYYNDNGMPALKGSTTNASTVFLSIAPTDNRLILSWSESVPWSNTSYDIFKLNDLTSQYDSLTTVTTSTFSDTGLVNGNTYCYYIRSRGLYTFPGFVDPILNRSQQVCSVPVDNVNPCSPELSAQSFCLDKLNRLVWTNPNNTCADDVLKYYIYYSQTAGSGFERIDSVLNPNDTIYLHANLSSLAGCYRVTAVDSVGNETINPVEVCVDTCRQYVLPSVFTPNNDGKNDLFHPCDSTTSIELQQTNCPPYLNVKDVEMKIFNRWGTLVFETTDRDINWDGKHKDNGVDCPDGVYFYTCRVNFFRISGTEIVELNGYVHLIRSAQ
ncbi:MAG: gliding motility-associated C-terminal domain-containing protein [Bacteroidetes bacterium]|nr:MAG: gliding motility-associated C-terminal domain-containing protein [Bacteroidota bacterium]REK03412.1 MAG: gliding motility-associated C-terminal domain-containing protein [Bacteroidota bacterium]REK34476.1 MAG: gliding motility-associated C-terminal domain-containing protein [Bacteroidota bacterium]REK50406.1 MAG: gliding motility-associated C-terminal domain-containing protein [Bacteroidota bacterium]